MDCKRCAKAQIRNVNVRGNLPLTEQRDGVTVTILRTDVAKA
jgi:hypothetical protein